MPLSLGIAESPRATEFSRNKRDPY